MLIKLELCFNNFSDIVGMIVSGSIGFVMEAYEFSEISDDPGGLSHRYLIKAVIPFSFILIMISAVGFVLRNINIFRGTEITGKS